MNAQFKRGIVEMLVLKVVADKSQTSFDVIDALADTVDVNENTVYPILRRLAKQGYFDTAHEPSPVGAPRKTFSITDEGRKKLADFQNEWETFLHNVLTILGGNQDA